MACRGQPIRKHSSHRYCQLNYDTTFYCKPKLIGYSDYMKKQFDIFGKTQSEINQHLKRTRKTRVQETCKKYNTTSYSEAQKLDTIDLCARINLALLCKKLEQAVIDGNFAEGEKLSYKISRLKPVK